MKRMIVLAALLTAATASAKEKPRTITLHVVNSWSYHKTYQTAGRAPQSTTDCQSGTDWGTLGTNTTCETTYDPGVPPGSYEDPTSQVYARAINEGGHHIVLWCQVRFREELRECFLLESGDYTAEVKGDTAWIFVPGSKPGKKLRVKYKIIGAW